MRTGWRSSSRASRVKGLLLPVTVGSPTAPLVGQPNDKKQSKEENGRKMKTNHARGVPRKQDPQTTIRPDSVTELLTQDAESGQSTAYGYKAFSQDNPQQCASHIRRAGMGQLNSILFSSMVGCQHVAESLHSVAQLHQRPRQYHLRNSLRIFEPLCLLSRAPLDES